MDKHISVPVTKVSGEEDEYMSDGLPMDEKEDLVVEEYKRRNTEVHIRSNEKPHAVESKPKKNKKKREVIVDVQEIEIEDENDLIPTSQPSDTKDQSEVVLENPTIEALPEEHKQSPTKEALKIDIDEIRESTDNFMDDEVMSPAINVIDSDNRLHHILDQNQGRIEEDDESQPDNLIEEEHHVKDHSHEAVDDPDRCKNQEELEKFIHKNEHEDEKKLNIHEIIEHPEHFDKSHSHDVLASLEGSDENQVNTEDHMRLHAAQELEMKKSDTIMVVQEAHAEVPDESEPPSIPQYAKEDSLHHQKLDLKEEGKFIKNRIFLEFM